MHWKSIHLSFPTSVGGVGNNKGYISVLFGEFSLLSSRLGLLPLVAEFCSVS